MNLFEGDDRYRSPIIEDRIWSVLNMSEEDFRAAILEQVLILYFEYKREQFTFEEMMSSLKKLDCINVFVQHEIPNPHNRLERHWKEKGAARYWKIWTMCYDMVQTLISSGHLILVKEDKNFRNKDTVIRFFPENSSEEAIRTICQNLMNEAGVWWEGYPVPEGEVIIQLTDKGKALLENNSIEDISAIMAYEMENGSTDETIN